MKATEFSITRTKPGWKPRVEEVDVPIFKKTGSDDFLISLGGSTEASFTGDSRSLVAHLPYCADTDESCSAERVEYLSLADLPEGVTLDYRIDGGFNNNCVLISWKIEDTETYAIDWVALKTFTGIQMKYLLPNKKSPLIFAFAQEDAFAYCNKMPCDECAFRCKRGMYAYIHVKGLGVVKMPIERVSMIQFTK